MTILEALHTVKVQVSEDGDLWKAALVSVRDTGVVPIGNFSGLTSAEVFHKFGIKTPEAIISKPQRRANAESILRERLASLGTTTIVTRTDYENHMLDILNALGHNDEEE